MAPRVTRLRDCLSLPSRATYLLWRLGVRGRRPLQVRTRSGQRLVLRPAPSSDVPVAMEVLAVRSYHPPAGMEARDVRRIVDLGANAGFTVVDFAARYPVATIEAYEPHPGQLAQLREHIRLNGLEGRVTVRPVAVSNRPVAELYLSDADAMAQLHDRPSPQTVAVPVIDWFPEAERGPIDLLKVDIEGSEREILRDPRFLRLDVRLVMLEWHALPDWPDAEQEVKGVLTGMGMRVADGPRGHYQGVDCGVVWAAR